MRRPIVGVIGGNDVADPIECAAEALGMQVADQNAILLTGGQPTGPRDVKRAAMRGALSAMGTKARLVGILPVDEKFKRHADMNDNTQCFVDTKLPGAKRNPINALTPDVIVVLTGKAGTLAELGFALAANKPIFFSQGSFDALRAIFETDVEERKRLKGLISKGTPKYIELCGKGLAADIEGDLLARLFSGRTKIDEGLTDVSKLIKAAIGGLGHAYRFMDSGFPGLPGVLAKAAFEEWLCQMP